MPKEWKRCSRCKCNTPTIVQSASKEKWYARCNCGLIAVEASSKRILLNTWNFQVECKQRDDWSKKRPQCKRGHVW